MGLTTKVFWLERGQADALLCRPVLRRIHPGKRLLAHCTVLCAAHASSPPHRHHPQLCAPGGSYGLKDPLIEAQ